MIIIEGTKWALFVAANPSTVLVRFPRFSMLLLMVMINADSFY